MKEFLFGALSFLCVACVGDALNIVQLVKGLFI
jgi:hypothetical protein